MGKQTTSITQEGGNRKTSSAHERVIKGGLRISSRKQGGEDGPIHEQCPTQAVPILCETSTFSKDWLDP